MQCLDDFRLSFKGRDFLPLMVGGMGTNISTANLVLAIEKLGGMAHLSDAMLPDVADREIGTHFTKEKTIRFKSMIEEADKTEEKFNLEALSRVSKQYFSDVMEKATGKGLVLVDWRNFKMEDIVKDVVKLVKDTGLNVPVLGAGGIFSGKEAVDLMKKTGASGIQAATRFTIAQESGLPDPVKQVYIDAKDEDVEVNHASPTGYLMRMLKNSPALTANNRPNCESYGYMLSHGSCPYLKEWLENSSEKTKCCLCTNMRNYKVWTCGTSVSRLKTTTVRGQDGKWVLPTAEQIFNDYRLA